MQGILCEICHKNRATIHIVSIGNNSVSELHICDECREKGYINLAIPVVRDGEDVIEIGPMKEDYEVCDSCRISKSEIRTRGEIGCINCIKNFEGFIERKLIEIHKNPYHIGKIPAKKTKTVKFKRRESIVYDLKIKLKQAVLREEYELAALYRDKINSLTKDEG